MKRCLVLGASGFLGREVLPVLRQDFDITPTAMNHASPGFIRVDIRDAGELEEAVKNSEPQAVVALAAYREPDFCEEHPDEAEKLNTSPYRKLIQILPPKCQLLFVSTDYVFDGNRPPYTESARRNPLSVYGKTKADAEDIVLSRPGSMVLRVPLLMGWSDDPFKSGFFSQLMNDLRAGGSVVLDDVLARYPVWTRDAGLAIRALLQSKATGVFHYSTPEKWTRYRAALEMGKLMGLSSAHIQPSHEVVVRKARRPADARLVTERWDKKMYPEPHSFAATAQKFIEQFGLKA